MYVSRGARLWLATRAALTAAMLLAGTNPARLSAAAAVEVILMSVVVSFVDTHHRRERALLANLGVRPIALGVLFAGPALLGEIALRLGGAAHW